MRFAEVIVDVPAKAVNRPFDYAIPSALEAVVEPGSRVGVPFGKRVIQGFVTAVRDTSEVPANRIKELVHVLDPYPVLTPSLIELTEWMSSKYICSRISCMQAMLPGALKAKYDRMFAVQDQAGQTWMDTPMTQYVREKGEVSWDELHTMFPDEAAGIRKLLSDGILMERTRMKDRLQKKMQLVVYPHPSSTVLDKALADCPPQAKRQRELIAYFLDHPEPIVLSELLVKLEMNASTVKRVCELGCAEMKETEMLRDPYADRDFGQTTPLSLTIEQQEAYDRIVDALHMNELHTFLLHGVTGSGKTEIYLQSIATCLARQQEAIVLVPEISLTPQMVERFKGRFGDRVAVLHSRLSQGERYDEWRKLRQGQAQVVVGARSAIFAPLERLGLIIIDEEHESSYKQEETPRYHARDAALQRAKLEKAVVVLGSATPSLETYEAGLNGSLETMTLPNRVGARPLPRVHVIDMRHELKQGNRSMFSRPLHEAIVKRLERKEQMVLMLNRRGFSTFVMCRSCGYVAECPHCQISLTYHRHIQHIRCHYCGYTERELETCPSCQSQHIRYFGTGTQRVEEELVKLFPGIRVIRMDVDTTTEKGSHEKWLTQFGRQQADVLLGTQMIAKGLDFPNVTLVGVIAADTILNLPDFRGAERTFQLLTQVAGRAGRHELPGEVFVQSYAPEHYAIELASRHHYQPFANKELVMRKLRDYPPYKQLVLFTVSHEMANIAMNFTEKLGKVLKEKLHRLTRDYEVMGPVASPIARLKDRYRFQCMIKYARDLSVTEVIEQALEQLEDEIKNRQVRVTTDVDPYILM
ncbi:primosomal protein N' [Marinicrinis sediminis]|uniref:Replication restart protein PriA n=1 Tax=Marinicrinis sediminis TaxID=1652465 RepID=A0ABW5R553_9BACL